MKKSRYYSNTKFPANVIAEAHQLFLSKVARRNSDRGPSTLRVSTGDESWEFDSVEEFLAEYAIADGYTFDHIAKDGRLWISSEWPKSSLVSVTFPSRPPIEAVFQVFEKNLDKSALPESAIVTTTPLKIFIGHGRDPQWRDLKDHLHEKQGLDVVAYEIGPRAGLSVKEVLEEMLQDSSFAVLVLTGEDLHTGGDWHARENVIHEVGLFQGSLGFEKAIILLEDGVKEFSNVLGINHVPFAKGSIRETFGEVLAVIRREFGAGLTD